MAQINEKPIDNYNTGSDVRVTRTVIAALVLLFAISFAFRLSDLSGVGFAEDEVNKVDAVSAYARGDITANAEHPMLMKSLMFVSQRLARALDGFTDEAVFRFPNVLFGSLTIIPLFLLTAAFFDRWTGLAAAGFWSVGVNAISINRIGKEDTLLVFFMLFAFYFYLRAKQTDPRNTKRRSRNYLWSGISFGLMCASKYFPHYLGLNSLYHHYIRVRKKEPGAPGGKTSTIFYVSFVVAFLIANPAILLPQVWTYLNAYMGEKLLVHTGYLFADQLYRNNISRTPFWATPIYFYLVFMAIKIPLLVLTTFLIGLVTAIRRWKHPGHAFILFMFLFWIVPYSIMGAKWLRYTLSLMPFVYMFAAVGLVKLMMFVTRRLKTSKQIRTTIYAGLVVVFIGVPAWQAYSSAPHYALYTNALAKNHIGYFFPHDEFYDDGLREAIKFVCDNAGQGATIAHETPAVTRYYLQKFNRTDLDSKAMSTPEFDPAKLSGPTYFIVQRGRTYFENRDKLEFIRNNYKRVHEVKVAGITAAEVYVNQ